MEPTPSIGRIVHFYPAGSTTPQAALVIKVWSDTCINVSACNENGTWGARTSVPKGTADLADSDRWAWPARV